MYMQMYQISLLLLSGVETGSGVHSDKLSARTLGVGGEGCELAKATGSVHGASSEVKHQKENVCSYLCRHPCARGPYVIRLSRPVKGDSFKQKM